MKRALGIASIVALLALGARGEDNGGKERKHPSPAAGARAFSRRPI